MPVPDAFPGDDCDYPAAQSDQSGCVRLCSSCPPGFAAASADFGVAPCTGAARKTLSNCLRHESSLPW
jgi:hypothetical protein